MMKLEVLPNEVFLEIFDYLNGVDILTAFYGLNSRFNYLIYKVYRLFRFRFLRVSKRTFDSICQQHLPAIADRVVALQLNDTVENPEQIIRFFTHIPSLKQFIYLQSFTICHLRSSELLLKLTKECQQLCQLTSLSLYKCSVNKHESALQQIFDNIWSIPTLITCSVTFDMNNETSYFPTTTSTSLQSLSNSGNFPFNQMHHLFDCTPRLKYLLTYIEKISDNDYIPFEFSMLITLSVHFTSSVKASSLVIFFQNTPHLCHLKVDLWSTLIDGHEWEKIIRNNLPKLKTFQIEMKESFHEGESASQIAEETINSFRGSFWTIEHQWYVRCMSSRITVHLKSLIKKVYFLEAFIPDFWQSTCPHDNQQQYYDSMTWLYYTFFDKQIASNIRLPNINSLYVRLPIKEQLWSIVPNLNRLKSIHIESYTDSFVSQVQMLLDRATNVQSLTIQQNKQLSLQTSLYKCSSASIVQLDLGSITHDATAEECLMLARSPLLRYCQALYIRINNCEGVTHLIDSIPNLRVLIIKHQDANFLQQLKDHLPSTYTIASNSGYDISISIWI